MTSNMSAETHGLKVQEDHFEAKHPSDVIGDWGPIQRRIVIILLIAYLISPFNNMAIILWTADYDFYCHHSDQTTGSTVSLKNACNYEMNGVSHKCSNFTYDTTVFKRTLVSQFDLVCDRSYYRSLAKSIHQLGYMVSGNLIGYFSDHKGRFFSIKASIILEIVAGFGQAFAPSIHWFMAARFFVGIAAYGRFLTSYVLVAEWVGPKQRPLTAVLYEFGYAIANFLLPVCFWLNTDYFVMQTIVSTSETIVLLIIVFVVWESPRWLLTHGRYEEAERNLKAAAKANKNMNDVEIDRRIQDLKANCIKQFEEEKESEKTKESMSS